MIMRLYLKNQKQWKNKVMTQEDKELLLKDLSARLPYQPLCKKVDTEDDFCECDAPLGYSLRDLVGNKIIIKPYLRPMSSMTEEEFESLKEYSELIYDQLDLASFQNGAYKCLDFYLNEVPSYVVIKVFDWLNRNHFDYRGLIEMGLAIAVTKENNPYE